MLDANDIQIISKIVSEAIKENNEVIRADMMALLEQNRKETHADMMTIIESEVNPKLRLLAEGQEAILEKVVPVSRIEAIEEDVIVLKAAVRHLSDEVQALKKAQ